MNNFIVTPTNIDYLESIFKNNVTGRWEIPVMTFNPIILNPFLSEIDPLNEDKRYHERVINYFYTKLTEKWLYKDAGFRKLLKYFNVEKAGENSIITLKRRVEKDDKSVDEITRKYIFKYIEKYFITERLIRKILTNYVAVTHIKWYDLFSNQDAIKELFAHRLKKLIIQTIEDLNEKQ